MMQRKMRGKRALEAFCGPLALAITVLAIAACGSTGGIREPTSKSPDIETTGGLVEPDSSYTSIDAEGLATMLKNKDFTMVNVHIPYAGEIENSDLFIPFNEIRGNLDRLPSDKDTKLVVYCRSGGMSAIASRALVEQGYTNVWNLEGGMRAWQQAGYPLLNNPSTG